MGKTLTKFVLLGGLFGLSLLSFECPGVKNGNNKKLFEFPPEKVNYFGEIPMKDGIAMTSADFDGDGDVDLIVGTNYSMGSDNDARLYFFENDGKGNFKLREYEKQR